jgi:endoglucanase Acf2
VNGAGSYIIYALSPITLKAAPLTRNTGIIQATSAFTGVIRVVMLGDPTHKSILDAHVATYATSAVLDYQFTSTTATLIFYWNVVGNGPDLLMLTWPHHRLTMQSPNFPPTSSLSYLTTKANFIQVVFWTRLIVLTHAGLDVPSAFQQMDDALQHYQLLLGCPKAG